MKPRLLVAIVLFVSGLAGATKACTTIVFQDGESLWYARNFDWHWGDGMIIVNPRGIAKTAFVPTGSPASWTAEYGSVTFNQFGREMPYGGINEAGLVIAQMMLFASEYPEPDDRPAVNMLQWIQYQLDTCATLEDVVASDALIRTQSPTGKEKIHYLVCDAAGHAGTIEFLEGKMVCHRGKTLPITALTNNTFQESSAFAEKHRGLGGELPVPDGNASLHRFARAAMCSREFKSRSVEADRDFCFEALREVAQGSATVWSMVYDIPRKHVYLRTQENPNLRWIQLGDLNFSPAAAPQFLNINAAGEGNIAADFRPLTAQQHKAHLLAFFRKPDVQQRYGDLAPMADLLNVLLGTYRVVAEQEVGSN